MGVQDWAQIGAAMGVGSIAPWLWRKLWRDAKGDAEARKLNVESDGFIADRLYAEIERLDHDMKDVRDELATVKNDAADEKSQLEGENKRLRYEVSSLRKRVSQLEEIIKTKTTPEDMRAQLAEIDRKTGGTAK